MKKSIKIATLCTLLTLTAATACGTQNNGSTPESEAVIQSSEEIPMTETDTAEPQKITAESQKITAEEAYEKMQSGEAVVIVDVREQEEYDQGHVPGAILIPNGEITSTQPEELPDLDAEILIYCRSGNRSAQAAKKLSEIGYTNLYDFGGIMDWPYETEK